MKQGNASYILRLTAILLAITAITAALLGLVNQITADKIAAITKEKTDAAMSAVLAAETYTEITDFTDETGMVDTMYQADDLGYVLQVTCSGSQGAITMMVGVDMAGAVTGISIINHSETPGLGDVYAKDSAKGVAFRDSFVGLTGPLAAADVDFMSGATVTANGVCTGVNAATACVAAYLG